MSSLFTDFTHVQIRHTHRYGYRSGEWAEVMGLVVDKKRSRLNFMIYFADNPTLVDFWPVYEDTEYYEFRAKESAPK
jgi:hypothetical protein